MPAVNKFGDITRRLPSGRQRAGLRKHAKLVGEVIWAWNELHLSYAFTFQWALGIDNWARGQAIWTALNNDGAQRDILSAILDLGHDPTVVKGVKWAIKETGKLAP